MCAHHHCNRSHQPCDQFIQVPQSLLHKTSVHKTFQKHNIYISTHFIVSHMSGICQSLAGCVPLIIHNEIQSRCILVVLTLLLVLFGIVSIGTRIIRLVTTTTFIFTGFFLVYFIQESLLIFFGYLVPLVFRQIIIMFLFLPFRLFSLAFSLTIFFEVLVLFAPL